MAKQFAAFANDKLRLSVPLPAPTWTVAFWVKVNSGAVTRPFFYRYNNTAPPYVSVGVTGANAAKIDLSTNAGGTSGTTLVTGTWYHMAVVFQNVTSAAGRSGWMYLNGNLDFTVTGTQVTPSNDLLMFGGNDDADSECGFCSMCCIKLWDGVVLTQDEIQAEMWSARAAMRDGLLIEAPLQYGVEVESLPGQPWTTMAGTLTDPDEPPGVEMWVPRRRMAVKAPAAAGGSVKRRLLTLGVGR